MKYTYHNSPQHDLVTPDGRITKLGRIGDNLALAHVRIENIAPNFVGYALESEKVFFNFKSILAQMGLNGVGQDLVFDRRHGVAEVKVEIATIGPLARQMLALLGEGAYIGKLFAQDERRKIYNPDYLRRMFGRSDREGRPLLSFGGVPGDFPLEVIDSRLVAFLKLKNGKLTYSRTVEGFLPTLSAALKDPSLSLRKLLRFHQQWQEGAARLLTNDEILLVRSDPLHIRTVFARVVDSLLPAGYSHTSADILQPDTTASGDIFEVFGDSTSEITDLPLEFFKLEPYKEHVFFVDRDQLQHRLEEPEMIFNAFKTAPGPIDHRTGTFIVKGSQMQRLKKEDWVMYNPSLPMLCDPMRPDEVEAYIQNQPSYPFLMDIEKGVISSEGVLFVRYFPSPYIKHMLLSYYVRRQLKGIYFEIPSRTQGDYFSPHDRSLLTDLTSANIPVFWADRFTGQVLQYTRRPYKTSGMFVPLDRIETFRKATFLGIYGSNLVAGDFSTELQKLLQGILNMRSEVDHPLLHKNTPLALVTGGGPGAMEAGNKIAKNLGILSCAHVVDFRSPLSGVISEQRQNPYVEAKMSYRLDQVIERQADFSLDLPIFVTGGIGTDFELSLEELRHKVGAARFVPIILFGHPDYWRQKITSRFRCNLNSGTIKGSEWLSNSFFCVQSAEAGLRVYRSFFERTLPLGPNFPIYEDGFVVVE